MSSMESVPCRYSHKGKASLLIWFQKLLGIKRFPGYNLTGVNVFLMLKIYGKAEGFDLDMLNKWIGELPSLIREASKNRPSTSGIREWKICIFIFNKFWYAKTGTQQDHYRNTLSLKYKDFGFFIRDLLEATDYACYIRFYLLFKSIILIYDFFISLENQAYRIVGGELFQDSWFFLFFNFSSSSFLDLFLLLNQTKSKWLHDKANLWLMGTWFWIFSWILVQMINLPLAFSISMRITLWKVRKF